MVNLYLLHVVFTQVINGKSIFVSNVRRRQKPKKRGKNVIDVGIGMVVVGIVDYPI